MIRVTAREVVQVHSDVSESYYSKQFGLGLRPGAVLVFNGSNLIATNNVNRPTCKLFLTAGMAVLYESCESHETLGTRRKTLNGISLRVHVALAPGSLQACTNALGGSAEHGFTFFTNFKFIFGTHSRQHPSHLGKCQSLCNTIAMTS